MPQNSGVNKYVLKAINSEYEINKIWAMDQY